MQAPCLLCCTDIAQCTLDSTAMLGCIICVVHVVAALAEAVMDSLRLHLGKDFTWEVPDS